jgi:hypothetical protein
VKEKTTAPTLVLIVVGAVCALLNPVIGSAAINFDAAAAQADPLLFVRVITQPWWVWLWMPLFFVTDSLGWYILPSMVMRRLAVLHNLPNRRLVGWLSWLYSIVGHLGVFVFVVAYALLLYGTVDASGFVAMAGFSYDWIWGTVNNLFGFLLFTIIGWNLVRLQYGITGHLNLVTAGIMLVSSLSMALGTLFNLPVMTDIAGTISTPLYLFTFPCAVLSYAWSMPTSQPVRPSRSESVR